MLGENYFLADLHLGHAKVLLMDSGPFPTINERDAAITANCLSLGKRNRTLWLLGDVAFRRGILESFMAEMRKRWGKIILIRGNHDDRVAWQLRDIFDEAHEARYLRINKDIKFYLSHYAHRVWRNSSHGSYHVHGHSHGALSRWGRSIDVGANVTDYRPMCDTEIVSELQDQPYTNHH
jgi:calcineurin-like phosphoesterase family protein